MAGMGVEHQWGDRNGMAGGHGESNQCWEERKGGKVSRASQCLGSPTSEHILLTATFDWALPTGQLPFCACHTY